MNTQPQPNDGSADASHSVRHHGEFDHLLWVVQDLAAGVEEFADLTGVQARIGGHHPWTGTRNALVALGGVTYIEIVAPDLGQDLDGTIGGALTGLESSGLWTFAHSHRDLDELVQTAAAAGYSTAGPRRWNRRGRDGSFMEWAVGFAGETEFGPAAPFYVDWEHLTHPTTKMAPGVALQSLTALGPDPEAMSLFYDTIGIDVAVASSSNEGSGLPAGAHGVTAEIDTPNGLVTLPPLDVSQVPLLRSTPAYMFRDEQTPDR